MKKQFLFASLAMILGLWLASCGRDSNPTESSSPGSNDGTINASSNDVSSTGGTFKGKSPISTNNTGSICVGGVIYQSADCDPTKTGTPMEGVKVLISAAGVDTFAFTGSNGVYVVCGLPEPPAGGTTYTLCIDVNSLPAAIRTVIYSKYGSTSSYCQSLTIFQDVGDFNWVLCGNTPPPPGPCTVIGSINSNFNGTAITGTGTNPGYLWFNSNFNLKGMTEGKHVNVSNSTVVINGTSYNVPDAVVTFTNSVSCATTSFDGTKWVTFVPLAGSDEIFLTGLVLPLPNGLPGGARVNWIATISTDQPGICLNWKWSAASYKPWPLDGGGNPDYNAAKIKATHNTCAYSNGDHAGTPENPAVKQSVTGGARGGGGSNWTGSWSSTGSACPICP